jgi:uncharacterized membrane protein
MSKLTSFPGGLLLGASLMYFLDPIRGRGRRRRIQEAMRHAERVERDLFGKAARDTRQRIHGLVERVSHPPARDVADEVIEQRIRARLGRAVSHPRAIDINVVDRRVILRGPILANEAIDLIKHVRAVSGVREIVDRLERHTSPGNIPALQGQGRRRKAKGTWPPAAQAGATSAGALLLAYGLLLKRGLVGTLLGTAGGALALRGSMNRPLPELLGARGAPVTVQKSIVVHQPIEIVFDCWSRFDNFPMFMQHVREVDLEVGGNRSRWTVDGPAHTKVEFEAETIDFIPDRTIAWRTVDKQPIEHEGRVRFEEVPGGTRVTVTMSYRPPGGVIGHAVAHILGWDPKARMDEDLVRMKTLLEEGKTRAHQQHVELADLH